MIKLDEKEEPKLTLWQMMKLTNEDCLDITDEDWDWGIAMCVNLDKDAEEGEEPDWYDRFMKVICMNINVIKYQPDYYTITDIAKFMWDNKDIFEPWFNENNGEGYRPKDYPELEPNADTGFYEAYMEPMECLIAGNYSDEDYKELYRLFEAKSKKEVN